MRDYEIAFHLKVFDNSVIFVHRWRTSSCRVPTFTQAWQYALRSALAHTKALCIPLHAWSLQFIKGSFGWHDSSSPSTGFHTLA